MSGYLESSVFDPYENLALEEILLERAESMPVLYLWQNAHTVVIGKNQNPWKECRTTLLQEEGGRLARRLSGGGAVYHDLGNLNFTILLPRNRFDLPGQMEMIRDAVADLGIHTELSGRNDVLAAGRKFSGNAFYKGARAAYHHGTILVSADMERLGRYLSPDRKKLQGKGVDSVPSRVINLAELAPGLTVDAVKRALLQSFEAHYGPAEALVLTDTEQEQIRALAQRNQSWQWNYGQKQAFGLTWEERFSWGGVEIGLQVESGMVGSAKVYTDAMDPGWAPVLEQALTGCRFAAAELSAAVEILEPALSVDLKRLIEKQEI